MPVVAMNDVRFKIEIFDGFKNSLREKRKPLHAIWVLRPGFTIDVFSVKLAIVFDEINRNLASEFRFE